VTFLALCNRRSGQRARFFLPMFTIRSSVGNSVDSTSSCLVCRSLLNAFPRPSNSAAACSIGCSPS
jgi:hypothetical protein